MLCCYNKIGINNHFPPTNVSKNQKANSVRECSKAPLARAAERGGKKSKFHPIHRTSNFEFSLILFVCRIVRAVTEAGAKGGAASADNISRKLFP